MIIFSIFIEAMSDVPPITKIPKFLKRLFRETSDLDNKNIGWSDDWERIQILDKEYFIKNTLPFLSRTKEYSAFIRLLNIYGFVKVKSDRNDELEEYYNCYFKRDQPNLLGFIKRVLKSNRIDNKLNLPSIENHISYLTNNNYKLANEISQLKDRVDKQERTINGLLDILGRVFRNGAQNINFEASQGKQRTDNFSNYGFNSMFAARDDVEPLSPASTQIVPKKDKDKKVKTDKFLGDMSDIFF